jgi:diguanylate cyclase (GGDEF)-like protein
MTKPTLTVKARLLGLGLGLVGLFGATVLLLGYLIERDRDAQQLQQSQSERFETIYGVDQAMHRFRHANSRVTAAMLSHDTEGALAARRAVEAERGNLEQQLRTLAQFDTRSAELVSAALIEVPTLAAESRTALLDGDPERAAPVASALQARWEQIEDALNATSNREHASATAAQVSEREYLRWSIRIAMAAVVLSVGLALLLTFSIIRSIIGPLRATTEALDRVNAGQLDIDIPQTRNDEFGAIARALHQYREQAERLRRLAYQDALTGLGNRARLEEDLPIAIERARRLGEPIALIYVDIDNFRAVNDKLGHKVGDRYLIEATARLHRFMPPDSLLCRYGGDKFTILVPRIGTGPAPELLLREQADALLRGLGEAWAVGDDLLNMSASIGVSVFPGDGETSDQLISAADAAVLAAKKRGRNTVCFASNESIGTLRRQMSLASDIRRGIERGEFEPFYQPVIDVERGRVIGAEALLRWRHPENGLLPPGDFVHVAEESGLVGQLGELCLRKAYEQALAWNMRGRRLRIAVNLSVRQVHDGKIIQILRSLGKPPPGADRPVEFELTESALLDPADYSHQVLVEVKRLGFRIGLDDFGTGYSSFSYLQRLPIDKIKIDRQFVTTMGASKQALAIVSATLTLAQNLDLSVVAEGVENAEQMRQLKMLGCRLQQGFFFTRALPAAEFENWVIEFEKRGMNAMIEAARHREPPMTIPVL